MIVGGMPEPNGKFKIIDVAVSEEAYDDADDVAWDELDNIGEDGLPF